MALEIFWTKRASEKFEQILLFLESEWGFQVTRDFASRTMYIVELLAKHPEIGSMENEEKNIRGVLLSKHNRLFYRFDEKQIMIIGIFDTRKRNYKGRM